MKIEALKPMEAATLLELPEIESGFNKLVDVRNHYYSNFGTESSGEKTLESIYLWWKDFENINENMSRFRSAITRPHIPPLEQQQVREEYSSSQQTVNQIVRGIVLLTLTEKPTDADWDKALEINTIIENVKSWEKYDNQIIAFCEAVFEAGEELSAVGIRLRVAQHSWDELTALFGYAKAIRVTTVDDIDSEKRELSDALRGNLWSEDELVMKSKVYKNYQKQLKSFPEDLRKKLKFLWKCAQGKIPRGTSAFDILHTQESILKDLYKEGAFDPEES